MPSLQLTYTPLSAPPTAIIPFSLPPPSPPPLSPLSFRYPGDQPPECTHAYALSLSGSLSPLSFLSLSPLSQVPRRPAAGVHARVRPQPQRRAQVLGARGLVRPRLRSRARQVGMHVPPGPGPALPCPALPCPALPCSALPCQSRPLWPSTQGLRILCRAYVCTQPRLRRSHLFFHSSSQSNEDVVVVPRAHELGGRASEVPVRHLRQLHTQPGPPPSPSPASVLLPDARVPLLVSPSCPLVSLSRSRCTRGTQYSGGTKPAASSTRSDPLSHPYPGPYLGPYIIKPAASSTRSDPLSFLHPSPCRSFMWRHHG